MSIDRLVQASGTALEIAGVATILVGVLVAAVSALRAMPRGRPYRTLRHGIGRAVLLGLELLVAADIIRSVATFPSLDDVAVLAGIVAIRTFLSVALEVELEGRWPWTRSRAEREEEPERAADGGGAADASPARS